jgi:uncharacterized protein (TIRG00374 family)
MKSKISIAIRAAVSIALITVLIYMMRDNIPKMLSAIKGIAPSKLFLGFMCFTLSLFFASLRLKTLLGSQGILLNMPDMVRLTYIGYFFSSFLPTGVGGDVVKAFYISKASNKAIQSYSSVFIDRFLGMTTIFLIATTALFFTKEIPKYYFKWLLPVLLVASGLFLIFLFNRRLTKALSSITSPLLPEKVKDKFKHLYDVLHNFTKRKSTILLCVLISITAQIIAFSTSYIFALGLDSYISLRYVLLAMPISSVASLVPSMYGVGPREMAVVFILSPLVGEDNALAIAFLWLGLLLITALIGGVLYMFMGRYRVKLADVTN